MLPVILALCVLSAAARAEDMPVEISAAQSLEWNRALKTYTARGDVVAKKGGAEIHSDTMTASYTEGKGGTEIGKITATGSVVIDSAPYVAHGDKGVFDAVTGDAVLTGRDLKVESGAERLTARDEIRYASKAQTLTATGGATAVKGAQTLKSENLTAHFAKDAKGDMITEKIVAHGGLVITTATETITGDAGVYNVVTQSAELTGRVRIAQGQSYLEGTKATVDMKTGLSRLTADGNAATGGRVKGVFYPKKQAE